MSRMMMPIYILSNTWATLEVQFIKKLSSTEADLKKSVAFEKKRVPVLSGIRIALEEGLYSN